MASEPRTRRKLQMWLLAAFILGSVCLTPVSGYAQEGGPRFELANCPIDVPSDPSIDCGTLTVPEDHDDPTVRTIQLSVIIIHSPSQNPHPDPVLFTEGGPGYSSLSSVWWLAQSALVDERDVIILEQRGNLYARPTLDCDAATIWLEETETHTACLDSLRNRGIDLTHYTTQQNAADVDALRRALHVETWNLYGSSYSTRLFLYFMQQYPTGVRSAMLDSTSPPQENRYLHDPEHTVRALNKLFADCAADEACAAAYPDLEGRFYDLFHRLNANPVEFTVTHDAGGHPLAEPLTEEVSGYTLLEWMVSDAFYDSAYAGGKTTYLPLLIDQVEAGNTQLLHPWLVDQISNGWGSQDGFAWGLYFAINCQNDFPAISPEKLQAQTAAYPQLEGYIRHAREIEICELWDLPSAPLGTSPLVSDIPTLVLAGGYDPITPPEWGRSVAQDLKQAYYYEFPAAGHGVAGESECARSIQVAFLADPEREPDGSCVAGEPDPEFVLPEDVLIAPGFYHSVADINLGDPRGKAWLEAVVVAAFLLFLVEMAFLLVTAILRVVSKKRHQAQPDLVARMGLTLAGVVAILGISVPLLMTYSNRLLNAQPVMRYFGLPADYLPVTLLGVVAVVFSILSGILMVMAAVTWARKYWSLPQRVLFSV